MYVVILVTKAHLAIALTQVISLLYIVKPNALHNRLKIKLVDICSKEMRSPSIFTEFTLKNLYSLN